MHSRVLLFILLSTTVNCELCSWRENFDQIAKCATVRALKTFEIAERQDGLEIIPGIALQRNGTYSARSAKKLEFSVQSANSTSELFDLVLTQASRFLNSRVLQIKLPLQVPQNLARSFEEARGKVKKTMGSLILGLGTRMMSMIPIMFGGLVLLTTKALIVGKLAFVISIILFVQVFFSGRSFPFFNHGGGTFNIPPTYGVPTTYGTNFGTNFGTNSLGGWSSAQNPYARSINVSQNESNSEDNS
ncbi:uncharacterized protein LOC123015480 [Tribolium madens]|uniref:uncharacterized protein LOC123015480 n=1 Tax=Tribolium madens TaxID=41895 RepID=UPI001CF7467D|nr:uncharacterized protein LOC123015480 [Tribolium madens]